MVDEDAVRQEICDAGRRLWELGLIGAGEGNISARIAPDRLLCTPSGLCKGRLTPSDLVTTDLAGTSLDARQPSSEVGIHLKAYQSRPDCASVVHAHPPTATAFTLCGRSWPDDLLPESAFVLGPVALVPFGFPGTDELPDQLSPYMAGHKTFLLSHHGAMTMGTCVSDACDRMETLERVAKLLYMARSMGEIVPLPSDARVRLQNNVLHGRLN